MNTSLSQCNLGHHGEKFDISNFSIKLIHEEDITSEQPGLQWESLMSGKTSEKLSLNVGHKSIPNIY